MKDKCTNVLRYELISLRKIIRYPIIPFVAANIDNCFAAAKEKYFFRQMFQKFLYFDFYPAGKNPYFQRAPLIENRTQSSFPLIPLFSANPEVLDEVNKGIRVDEKETDLLLRGLLQNKGLFFCGLCIVR